jgi:hypothetical protein
MTLGAECSAEKRDIMKKRKWKGNNVCDFCTQQESATIFLCPVAKAVWGDM